MALNSPTVEKGAKDSEFSPDYDEEGFSRRGSRIASVHDEDRATIGKQLELEAEDAIKYRTCSWQKVRSLRPARKPIA
jgi:hypothetical protein